MKLIVTIELDNDAFILRDHCGRPVQLRSSQQVAWLLQKAAEFVDLTKGMNYGHLCNLPDINGNYSCRIEVVD